MVRGVGDVDVSLCVDGEPLWKGQLCRPGGIGIAGEALSAGAGDRGYGSCNRVDAADALIVRVGEVEVAVGMDCETARRIDQGGRSGTAHTFKALSARTGDGGDDAGGCGDFTDAVAADVREVEISLVVECEGCWCVERGARGRAVVSGGPWVGASGDCRDDAAGEIDLADTVVVGVGDVKACGVDGEALGRIQKRGTSLAAVAIEALGSGPRDGSDVATSINSSDDVIRCLGEVEISLRVVGDGRWEDKGNCGRERLRESRVRNQRREKAQEQAMGLEDTRRTHGSHR